MKILDWYILKRYLGTFFLMLCLFAPIGIVVNLAEKIGKILENKVPFLEVVFYYLDFTVYFANLLFPIFLFLSVIWFTSKLASNTEVVAFLSSGVSFWRFLRPYMIGATLVCFFALAMGMFLAPSASKGFNEFKYQYLKKNKNDRKRTDVHVQISDNDYIYVSNYIPDRNIGFDFTLEHFEGQEMKYKIGATRISPKTDSTSVFTLSGYIKRTIVPGGEDILERAQKKDTLINFNMEDLTPVEYVAETLNYNELDKFIDKEEERGSSYISRYKVVAYKRWSVPVSAFILTIIAVAVSSIKRRGGMGANLAFGIVIAFMYVFFDKVFGTMAEQSSFSPLIAVWFPNIIFGILAIYLLYNAKR